jgi:hypothetical protein
MLALMDLKQNKKVEAKQRLEKLVAEEEVLKSMPSDTCWIVGQELDQFEDTRSVALRLFESAVSASNRSNMQIQYSPVSRLVKLYANMNRKDEARELLHKQLRSAIAEQYDAQYASYTRVENSIWAGNQFLELGAAVDAVRIYRELIDDRDALEQAGTWHGNQPEYFANQAQNGLKKALSSIQDADAGDAIKQLLAPTSDAGPDQPVLDLMLSAPDAKSIRSQRVDSSLASMLKSISQNSKVAAEIDSRLAALAGEHAADFSAPVALAVYRQQAGDKRADEVLARLVSMVEEKPLEPIAADRRPNSRQRRAALMRVPLWLVARDYVIGSDHKDAAERLAVHSLEAARRQVDNKFLVAILYEWGKLAADAGDRATAEKKWSELLAAVTKRPQRREQRAPQPPLQPAPAVPQPAPAAGAQSNNGAAAIPLSLRLLPGIAWFALVAPEAPAAAKPAPEGLPPLTISQFRQATEVALAAAEHAMPELSQRAVKEAMAGGIPVPDPEKAAPASQGMFVRTATTLNPSSSQGASAIETEVAGTLRRVFQRWKGDEYAPDAVYDLLHPIVLPSSRPADILLFADVTKLRDARAVSLGNTLVEWAARAKKLADLRKRVAARKQNPQSLIPALVLETLIELSEHKPDAARKHLEDLGRAVEGGALPQMVQVACLAAIPAADVPELKAPAYDVLQVAVRQETTANSNSDEASLGALAGMVSKHLAHEPDKVKSFYEAFLAARQQYYSRYGGDYGLYIQWRDWAGVAEAAAKAGVLPVAMDFMGRVVDFHYQNNPRPGLTIPLATSTRLLRSRSPQERYETWRDWTLPTKGRKTVRLLAEWCEPTAVPAAFLPTDSTETVDADSSENLLCNLTELVDAAQEANKLDELRELARAARDQKNQDAILLWTLVELRRGQKDAAEKAVSALTKSLAARNKPRQGRRQSGVWGDYVVFSECMKSAELAAIYGSARGTDNTPTGRDTAELAAIYGSARVALRDALRSQGQTQALVAMGNDYWDRLATDLGTEFRPGAPSGLRHWVVSSPRDLVNGAKPTWLTREGQVVHLPGPGHDTLQFKYPLTGDFEFSAECLEAGWAEGELGYGGIVAETHAPFIISTLSGHETLRRPVTFRHAGYNRLAIRVAGGKLQCLINGHVAYEEDASSTSPWIMLFSHAPRTSPFRNIRLTGEPVIPREVQLFSGNRMDGWNCSFLGESQPRHRLMAEKPQGEYDYTTQEQQREPTEPDWKVLDGMLYGKSEIDAAGFKQSWVYYHRPLCEGETFRYEFFYTPGSAVAHPTIGRLAFLLEPGGVDVHWIGRASWDEAVLGIPLDNRVVEPKNRRGPAELPLKANDWNQVAVKLNGDKIAIVLNDVEVYERTLESENQRLFGLFHDKRQAAKVRSAVLTGPWPERITPDLNRELLATDIEHSDTDRRVIAEMLDDAIAEHDVLAVAEKARALPEAERFELLKQWVLPSPDHATMRLYYRFDPAALNSAKENSEMLPHDGLVCPAVDLIAVAERLNKLPELREEIIQTKPDNVVQKRNRYALLALVDVKQGNDKAVRRWLRILDETVSKHMPKETPMRDRAAELVAAWVATERPQLRYAAFDLARRLLTLERAKRTDSKVIDWRRHVNTLYGRAEAALLWTESDLHEVQPHELRQWAIVGDRSLNVANQGSRPHQWTAARGLLQYRTAGASSWLYFQSPLRGKFEISSQQSTDGNDIILATYSGHAAHPREDLKSKRIVTLTRANRESASELQIPNWGTMAGFRVSVDGNKATTFVNGVQIHEETLAPNSLNPWVVLHAGYVGNDGTLQNVRISGDPQIPDEIDLIDSFGRQFWVSLYGESVAWDGKNENAAWRRAGEELLGQLRSDRSTHALEALLAYQRPMLEDGVIEFETYYVPTEFEVHPAIGRTAFVLDPSGTKLHTLTDPRRENENLPPDNETSIDGAAAVPLKANDWNKVVLSLKGDQLTIAVNGTEVANHALAEPSTERFFGLFRYANKTKARVRKLIYRGQWPKQLPELAAQELAFPEGGPLADAARHVIESQTVAISGSSNELEQQGVKLSNGESVSVSDDGATIMLIQPTDTDRPTGLVLTRPIEGDCDVFLEFDRLRLAPAAGDAQPRFALRLLFDAKHAAQDLSAELAIVAEDEDKQSLASKLFHRGLDGTLQSDTNKIAGQWKAGRFRIIRRQGLVYCLFAEKNSDEFRLLGTYPVGFAPISSVQVVAYTTGKPKEGVSTPLVQAVAKKLVLQTLRLADAAAGSAAAARGKP